MVIYHLKILFTPVMHDFCFANISLSKDFHL